MEINPAQPVATPQGLSAQQRAPAPLGLAERQAQKSPHAAGFLNWQYQTGKGSSMVSG